MQEVFSPSVARPGAHRRLLTLLAAVLVGVGGSAVALLAFGRWSVWVGPFQVQLACRFGRGATDVALPPLGRLTARTHLAPLRFSATLQDVRVPELTEMVSTRGLTGLVSVVEREVLEDVPAFAIRVLGIGVAGAAVLAGLVFRRRWRPVVAAVVAALVALGGSGAAAWRTYDPAALLTPTYSGSLTLAARLIGPARTALDRIDQFRAQLSRIVAGAARVYGEIQARPLGPADEVRVLHISDLHLSPLGFSFARELARSFDVELVIDTGDLTSFGTPAEAFVVREVASMGVPYVFVRGNHDSSGLERRLRRRGVIVANGGVVEVAGLRILGYPHPVFTPDRRVVRSDEAIRRLVLDAGERIAAQIRTQPRPPDVLAVHDDRMAEASAGLVPLVVSGHFHESGARVVNGTLFLRVGSTGGAGAEVFSREGGVPLEAEILYFQRGDPPTLVAFDVVQQLPETGSLTLTRHLVEEEFGTLVPSPSSSPSPSPPSPSPEAASPRPSPSGADSG
ncbi:MAG TPA: metallophosphoesterase [Actinomycetota bacterium]|nr:metallophosphoesterase [Actinomycetota bacterium]